MEQVECPHCEEWVEIDPIARDHFEDDEDYTCPKCGRVFTVHAEPTVHYAAADKQKAQC